MLRMKDIAEECNVSRSVVSFVLNGRAAEHGIAESTCRLVRSAAKRMGYCPNELARAVATGRNRVVGVVISSDTFIADKSFHEILPAQNFTMAIIAGILDAAAKHNYSIKLFHTARKKIPDTIRALQEQMITGMLLYELSHDVIKKTFRIASKAGIKCGVFNTYNRSGTGFGASFDDSIGISETVNYLVSLGHKRIACVTLEEPLSDFVPDRNSAYLSAMNAAGLHPRFIGIKSGPFGTNERLFLDMLSESARTRPTAFVCISDYTAAELFHAAYTEGIKVPDDISLTGFGNLPLSFYQPRQITSVSQPFFSLGQKSMELLLDGMEKNRKLDGINIKLPTRLCIKETCRKCPEAKHRKNKQFLSFHTDCQELIKISEATQLTMCSKLQKGSKS